MSSGDVASGRGGPEHAHDGHRSGTRHRVVVSGEDEGERIDLWLSAELGLSRTRVQKLIRRGDVSVEGRKPRKSELVEEGWTVDVTVPAPRPVSLEPQDLALDIVYQDEHLAVVDKPAGMVVHPAPGHPSGTLVNALLHHIDDLSGIGGRLRPGIVHRLDKDTSGLMLVAKGDAAHRALSEALKTRTVHRAYVAATWGHLREERREIEEPLGRDPGDRKRMAVRADGRHASTRVEVRERWPAAELVDVTLRTGRTHQIRVHMAHVGHPVVGDETYGAGWERGMGEPHRRWARELARRTPRQFLHARALRFTHPVSGETMSFSADLPPDLAAVAAWARSAETGAG